MCRPRTAAGGPYDCWNPPRPISTKNQRPGRNAQVGHKPDIPPRAPAPPRLPPKLPPRARVVAREDILIGEAFPGEEFVAFVVSDCQAAS